MLEHAVEQIARALGAVVRDDRVERLDPLGRLLPVDVLRMRRHRRLIVTNVSLRAHLDDVDERDSHASIRCSVRGGASTQTSKRPGPVAVGLVEVDGDDPAAAPAQQRQRADEHVAAAGRLDGVAPWSCRAGVGRSCNRAAGLMTDMAVVPSGHTGPVATAPVPEGPVVA